MIYIIKRNVRLLDEFNLNANKMIIITEERLSVFIRKERKKMIIIRSG